MIPAEDRPEVLQLANISYRGCVGGLDEWYAAHAMPAEPSEDTDPSEGASSEERDEDSDGTQPPSEDSGDSPYRAFQAKKWTHTESATISPPWPHY